MLLLLSLIDPSRLLNQNYGCFPNTKVSSTGPIGLNSGDNECIIPPDVRLSEDGDVKKLKDNKEPAIACSKAARLGLDVVQIISLSLSVSLRG